MHRSKATAKRQGKRQISKKKEKRRARQEKELEQLVEGHLMTEIQSWADIVDKIIIDDHNHQHNANNICSSDKMSNSVDQATIDENITMNEFIKYILNKN
jgi:hypothetical protein